MCLYNNMKSQLSKVSLWPGVLGTSSWQGQSTQTDWLYGSPDTDTPASTQNASLVFTLISHQLGMHYHTYIAMHNYFTEKNKLTQNCLIPRI